MARVLWDQVGERFYEKGVDRCVLYVDGQGYAWSGVASVNENPSGGEAKPFYIDGEKFLNLSAREEFEATIEAFYSPPEFDPCDGVGTVIAGVYAYQQPRKSFGLTYRTGIGSDLDETSHGYKIHLIYNALAQPAQRNHATASDKVDLSLLSWDITTKPVPVSGMAQSAHLVVDSTKVSPVQLQTFEDILYGTESNAPRLPDPLEVLSTFTDNGILQVVDNLNDTFTITGSVVAVQMLDADTYRITYDTVTILDSETAQITSFP